MGKYVANLIAARVAGQSLPPFRYRHEGSLATIGRRAAVVEVRSYSAHGLYWLDVLERGAHLLSNWPEESFCSRYNLAVELHDFQARRPPYYRGPPDRS
jgi:hypothetical protein